jgi:pentatricopeptide repeat protein
VPQVSDVGVVRVVFRAVTCMRSGPVPKMASTFFLVDDKLHVNFPQDTSAPLLMLNCRACLWRCIQALDAPASNVQRLRHDVNAVFLPSQRRQLSTRRDVVRKSETRPTQLAEVERLSQQGQEPWRNSAVAANQKQRERAALRPQPASERLERSERSERVYETPNLAKLGRRDPTMSERDWFNRKQELRYLQDPLELATFVRRELGKGRVTEMLQLVRMASHSMQCVVSWNHIIDHYLANERVGDALKVYNDVCWS